MCVVVLEFFIENVKPEEFNGARVLEVGSKYVNGSVEVIENHLEKVSPREL